MWRSCFLVAVLTGSVFPVSGFSNGKVTVSCGDMMPRHGVVPSPAPPPFNITVDTASFTPGDNITGRLQHLSFTVNASSLLLADICPSSYSPSTVTLQEASSTPTYFRGFLIEARDAGKPNSPAVGSFLLTDPQESQLLQCGHTQVFRSY